MDDALRIIFAGTPDFAAYHLQVLIDSPHDIVAVYTQPDRPAGRGKKLTASPVKQVALTHGLPVVQPLSLKDSNTQEVLRQHRADVMVVVAYGLILPEAVLNIPRFGCFNVHGSLLPRWRGAAPIQRALAAGDRKTGVTIMQMDAGLDTGDMLYKSECTISDEDTSASLHDKIMRLGPPALLATLEQLQQQQLQPEVQEDSLATYAEKISKEEALIDWSLPAAAIAQNIRAYNPFPIAYTFFADQRLKIYAATVADRPSTKAPGEILALTNGGLFIACGDGVLCIDQLQLPGKKPMAIVDVINGYSATFHQGAYLGKR